MRLAFFVFFTLLFISCSSSPSCYLRGEKDLSGIKRVAVLPFNNLTDRKEAGKIISNIFIQKLFNSGIYYVEEMGNVRQFFIRQRIRKKGELDLDVINMLGKQLGLDAVFLGVVEKYYQESDSGDAGVPEIAISARMLNVKNGRILWKCYHHKRGDDYIFILNLGKVRTISNLAEKVIEEMIETIGNS